MVKKTLYKSLAAKDFYATKDTDVIDKDNQQKPFLFAADMCNKRWILAGHRATDTEVYSFGDIVNYTLIYRERGTDVVSGDEYRINASTWINKFSQPIIKQRGFNASDVEYIAINVEYKCKAQSRNVCSEFVLYEHQNRFVYADIDDEMITQFIVIPTNGVKDEVGIEPYAMQIAGEDLSGYEMDLVFAAIFEDEFLSLMGELFFYSSIFG